MPSAWVAWPPAPALDPRSRSRASARRCARPLACSCASRAVGTPCRAVDDGTELALTDDRSRLPGVSAALAHGWKVKVVPEQPQIALPQAPQRARCLAPRAMVLQPDRPARRRRRGHRHQRRDAPLADACGETALRRGARHRGLGPAGRRDPGESPPGAGRRCRAPGQRTASTGRAARRRIGRRTPSSRCCARSHSRCPGSRSSRRSRLRGRAPLDVRPDLVDRSARGSCSRPTPSSGTATGQGFLRRDTRRYDAPRGERLGGAEILLGGRDAPARRGCDRGPSGGRRDERTERRGRAASAALA